MGIKVEYKIGDCQELIKEVPDCSIDLVLTSPPYGDLRKYGGYQFNVKALSKELLRVLKVGGVVVWVVGDKTEDGSESGTSFRQVLAFIESGFNLHDTMIYEKQGFRWPNFNRYQQMFEFMFVFSKGVPKTFNPIKDVLVNNPGRRLGRYERLNTGELKFRDEPHKIGRVGSRGNIWVYGAGDQKSAKDKIAFEHPAIFPDQLAIDHIKSWTKPGETVLDPFVGSGTTLRACRALRRNGIGFEINSEYEQIIRARISENVPEIESFESEPEENHIAGERKDVNAIPRT